MQTSTDLDLEILNDLDFELPCESQIKGGHQCTGKVAWMATYINGHPPVLVCHNAYLRGLAVMAAGVAHCKHCVARGNMILARDCWHYNPLPK